MKYGLVKRLLGLKFGQLGLFRFSINLPAFYHECCSLVG